MAEEKRQITIEELEAVASKEIENAEIKTATCSARNRKENLYDRMNLSVETLDKVIIGTLILIVLLVMIGMRS